MNISEAVIAARKKSTDGENDLMFLGLKFGAKHLPAKELQRK